MLPTTNPFQFLEVTESAPPDEFVALFSDYLVPHATALFQKGNVVLKGMEGAGKSMLLYLFKPEVRIAYDRAKKEFPVPYKLRGFIAAGMNFTKTGAIEFGQRRLAESGDDRDIPLVFADYVNHKVVADFLRSIVQLDRDIRHGRDELQINSARFDRFARSFASDACWFGALREVVSFDGLRAAIEQRLNVYRRFLNFNIPRLPEEILTSKTAVHEPVTQMVEHLWREEVVPRHVNVFVRLDQFEEISTHRLESDSVGTRDLRRILNKAFGTRDRRVFYRVGVRKYAWEQDLVMYGSSASLEVERDYYQLDLDELLRRKENRKTWIFPDFASTVFCARVRQSGFNARESNALRRFFGGGLPTTEKARHYSKTAGKRVLDLDPEWPHQWRAHLEQLALTDPLEAVLGAAWIRQQRKRLKNVETAEVKHNVWRARRWWRKERIPQALAQIAGRAGQRMMWCGANELLALSGGNILVFLNLCREVWAAHARTRIAVPPPLLPRVDCSEQALGVYQVSVTWHDKVPTRPGGSERQRFLDWMGSLLRQRLSDDRSMSYPGHNGFSVEIESLRSAPDIDRFLRLASDYGDLFDYPHTTREKNRAPRRKWYMMPILSPFYQLPVSHTKEPWYVDGDTVRRWLADAGCEHFARPAAERGAAAAQAVLFPLDSKE